MAATHFSVLYHRLPDLHPSPVLRADGTPAALPGTPTRSALLQVVRDILARHPATGVSRA